MYLAMTIQYPMAKSSVMTPTMIPAIASPRPRSPLWSILSRAQSTSPSRGSGPAPTTATSTSKIISSLRVLWFGKAPPCPSSAA